MYTDRLNSGSYPRPIPQSRHPHNSSFSASMHIDRLILNALCPRPHPIPEPESVLRSTQHQFEWKIKNFCSIKKESIFSDTFTCFDMPFRMQMNGWSNVYQIQPMEHNPGTKRFAIFFQLMSSLNMKVPIRLVATLGIKTADGSVVDSKHKILEFRTFGNEVGGSMFTIPFSNSKDFGVTSPDLTIVCSLSLEDTVSVTNSPEKSDIVLIKDLEDLLLSEREADVTITVMGKPFKAHRSILVARSTVFATMFQHDMVERQTGEVAIDDCDADSFQDFLVYLYTGKTDHVTADNAMCLYSTADKYSVEQLKVKCSKCISLNLSIDSICDVLVLATMHDDSELKKSATDYFIKNIKEILQTPKWLVFHSVYLKLAQELFLKTAEYIKV